MDNKKQKLLIEYLISSTDTFAICNSIVKADYFDPEYRNAVKFIKDYYEEYHTTPTVDQIDAEASVVFKKREAGLDEIAYMNNEIESFCKERAIEKAIIGAPPLVEKGDYGQIEKNIRDAIMVSLHHNLGLRYFDDPEARLKRMLESSPVIPTMWKDVDDALFGGISRKELLLVSANSGGGKSITLANLSFNFVQQGLNVLYVSLELSEDVVAQRFDTMYTGISRRDWKDHTSEIVTRLAAAQEGLGVLDIIQMPSGTTANDIHAFLKEYYLHYNMMPDLLVIDYIDKMNPNEKVDASDVWTKDKLVSEQSRDLGVRYDMAIATASQLNRAAVGATHHDHSQIAGGISKINEADVYWSILMTDAMKAKGEICFIFQKTRNSDGVGKTIYLKWDGKTLRILDNDDGGPGGLNFKKKESSADDLSPDDLQDAPTGSGLLDLMDF